MQVATSALQTARALDPANYRAKPLNPSPEILNVGHTGSLKHRYLEHLSAVSSSSGNLRRVVWELIRADVTRRQLEQWAVEAGHKRNTIRKILSQVLCSLGVVRRRPGGGRRSPPQASAIRAFAREQFGDQGDKFIHAASRAVRAEAAAACQRKQTALFPTGITPHSVSADTSLVLLLQAPARKLIPTSQHTSPK